MTSCGCSAWLSFCPGRKKRNVTLVMLGLENSGKTSVISSLTKGSREDIQPTVGPVTTACTFQRFNISFFDLSGSIRLRSMWEKHYAVAHGFVFVIDSNDTERMSEVKQALGQVMSHKLVMGKPLLVLGNKQDGDDPMDEITICNELDLQLVKEQSGSPCQVECCSLRPQGNRVSQSLREGLQWLLGEISKNFQALSDRVDRETAAKEQAEEIDKTERLLRIQQAREEREALSTKAAAREECESTTTGGQNGAAERSGTATPDHPLSSAVASTKESPTISAKHSSNEQSMDGDLLEESTSLLVRAQPTAPRQAFSSNLRSASVPSTAPTQKRKRKVKVGSIEPSGEGSSTRRDSLKPPTSLFVVDGLGQPGARSQNGSVRSSPRRHSIAIGMPAAPDDAEAAHVMALKWKHCSSMPLGVVRLKPLNHSPSLPTNSVLTAGQLNQPNRNSQLLLLQPTLSRTIPEQDH